MKPSAEPDLKFGANATDFWDGNWLNVLAQVEASGAVVQVEGPIVHASDLLRFTDQLETLYAALSGKAELRSIEPNLEIEIQCGSRGDVAAKISISPDHMTQSHEFKFHLDQSYLGLLLDGCKGVLSRWPIRSRPSA